MTTAATSSPVHANGIANMEFSRRLLEMLAEDFPEEKLTFQPVTGANHVLWQLGHMAWTDDYFLANLLGGTSNIPESWTELFGMGSEPTDEPGRYPSVEEVRPIMQERRAALCDWFRSRTEAQLAEPLPEDYQTFAPNFGALMGAMAAHESMHAGQITVIRKAIGLARKLG
ncbi:MAG: DinB family protein [Planctomycetota bacterium]|jgi:uncharacterized damage-inducible protein DinB